MKKIFTLVILLSMGITQIYAQCLECAGTTASGNKATSIGYRTTASGLASFAGGISSEASGSYSFAFGNNAKALDDYSIAFGSNAQVFEPYGIAIGNYAISDATNSYVFGQNLASTGSNSLTLGVGTSSSSPLMNRINNSIMFGVTSLPSLTILKQPHANVGYLGIGTNNPTEMVHVVGKLLIDRTNETASSLQFKHFFKNTPLQGTYYWDIYSNTDGLKFNTVTPISGVSAQVMIISSSGSVGIGENITIPQAKLHVDNNILAEGNITTLNKFVLTPDYNSTSEYWEISRTNTGLNYAYMDRALQNVLFMGNNGSIGVGTTAPAAMLDVEGSFKAQSANITGNAFINGRLGVKTSNPQAIVHLHDPQVLQHQKGTEDSTDINRGISKILQITNANNSGGEGFTIYRDPTQGLATLFFKQHDMVPLVIEGPAGGLTITPDGNIGINNDFPQAKLDVNGSFYAESAKVKGLICAEEIRVQLRGAECWPDFVFSKNYKLLPLVDVEQFISENQHLPNVPSSAEVEANGVELGEMNALLLQKVEELTLYIIQMEKRLAELEHKNIK